MKEMLFTNSRKTGAVSSAPPQGLASSFAVWRRASAPFALSTNSRKTGAVSSAPPFALLRTILVPIVAGATVIATGCLSCMDSMRGTYTDETGGIVLNLKPGGNAIFTFAGQPDACTYTVQGKQLLLTCKGESGALGFTIDKDGSLIPKSELITRMRKRT